MGSASGTHRGAGEVRECGVRGLQGSCMGDGRGCVVGAVGACMCPEEWRSVQVVVRTPGGVSVVCVRLWARGGHFIDCIL